MPFSFDAKGVAEVLGASRLRFGKARASGVPAILFGVSAIVLAAGVSRALREAMPRLPETVHAIGTADPELVKNVLTP